MQIFATYEGEMVIYSPISLVYKYLLSIFWYQTLILPGAEGTVLSKRLGSSPFGAY